MTRRAGTSTRRWPRTYTSCTRPRPGPRHTVVVGGMPGWQIALIAVGAALIAATVAVLADRARTARRKSATAAA